MAEIQENITPAPQPDEGVKTFTQEEVNKIVSERLSKFADYKDLKAKAEQFESLTERATKAEKELGELKATNAIKEAREKVAKETGVPANLLTGADEETCKAQAEAMLAHFKPAYPSVPDGGENNKFGSKSNADLFGDFVNQSLS